MALEIVRATEAAHAAAERDRLRSMRDAQAFLIELAESDEERYREKFADAVTLLEDLFARTDDLTDLTEIRATQKVIELARFLTVNAPISNDDLKLITFDLVKQPRQDKQMAFIAQQIDDLRFPWVRLGGRPTDAERRAAIEETARIWARQKASTNRRMMLGRLNESVTAATIEHAGYAPGAWPLKVGEFRNEMSIDGTKADLLVRLWDRRLLLIECKSSLSELNSYKRVGHEVEGKPVKWDKALPNEEIVVMTVLAGAMSKQTIEKIVDKGIRLAWQHDLEPLADLLNESRPI